MKIDKSLMSGSTTLLVLSLLSGEEMYGYQMITELARRSNHVFDLKEGTLYPILHGLEAEGLVSPEGGMGGLPGAGGRGGEQRLLGVRRAVPCAAIFKSG